MSGPLRIAVVGSGPAGFYAAGALLDAEASVEVDIIERLPTPWGLVRLGVAPDHPKIKTVTRVYEKTAAHPRFRYFGNVTFGGPKRNRLFMVASQSLYAVYVATQGAAPG